MDKEKLVRAISSAVPLSIASCLVENLLEMRHDLSAKTLGRSSPGKFVEAFVQALQFLDAGEFENKPDVDKILRDPESNFKNLPPSLRICGSRLSRGMYAVRSKRGMIHLEGGTPRIADLRLVYSIAQWLLTEILEHSTSKSGVSFDEVIAEIQLEVSSVVEVIDGERIVLHDLPVKDEIVLVLGNFHPGYADRRQIYSSLRRRPERTVKNSLNELWKAKLIHRDEDRFRLTQLGVNRCTVVIRERMKAERPA